METHQGHAQRQIVGLETLSGPRDIQRVLDTGRRLQSLHVVGRLLQGRLGEAQLGFGQAYSAQGEGQVQEIHDVCLCISAVSPCPPAHLEHVKRKDPGRHQQPGPFSRRRRATALVSLDPDAQVPQASSLSLEVLGHAGLRGPGSLLLRQVLYRLEMLAQVCGEHVDSADVSRNGKFRFEVKREA